MKKLVGRSSWLGVLALVSALATLAPTHLRADSSATGEAAANGTAPGSDDNFDRLDGTGASGERVDVVEWEGNLEIHVYPYGSLKGLGLKLDKTNKSKPVMVIAYRFSPSMKDVLVRRAILGIDLQEGFKAYKDPTETEFDKIIISNNGLSGQVASYKLDPTPTQLYPDGYPTSQTSSVAAGSMQNQGRRPASNGRSGDTIGDSINAPAGIDQDSGSIHPFFVPGGAGAP